MKINLMQIKSGQSVHEKIIKSVLLVTKINFLSEPQRKKVSVMVRVDIILVTYLFFFLKLVRSYHRSSNIAMIAMHYLTSYV